jgi:hypothetical protein
VLCACGSDMRSECRGVYVAQSWSWVDDEENGALRWLWRGVELEKQSSHEGVLQSCFSALAVRLDARVIRSQRTLHEKRSEVSHEYPRCVGARGESVVFRVLFDSRCEIRQDGAETRRQEMITTLFAQKNQTEVPVSHSVSPHCSCEARE